MESESHQFPPSLRRRSRSPEIDGVANLGGEEREVWSGLTGAQIKRFHRFFFIFFKNQIMAINNLSLTNHHQKSNYIICMALRL